MVAQELHTAFEELSTWLLVTSDQQPPSHEHGNITEPLSEWARVEALVEMTKGLNAALRTYLP
jgi:hypothetical protein